MPDNYRILSLDGGGSWALIQARALGKIYGATTPGREILKQFNLVAATSGGSLVAGALATNRTPDEIARLFLSNEIRGQIFVPKPTGWLARLVGIGPRYLTGLKLPGLREALSGRTVNGDTPLSSLGTGDPAFPDFLISSMDYDSGRAVFFRSNQRSQARSDPNPDDPTPTLAEALHGSSTAPVAFFDRPARLSTLKFSKRRFWDGAAAGFNNPVLAAVTEAIANGRDPSKLKILSIGTANVWLPPYEGETDHYLHQPFDEPTLLGDIRKLASSIVGDPPDAATYTSFRILHGDWSNGEPLRLIRMNPLIQPIKTSGGWRIPNGLSRKDFLRLVRMEIDAVRQEDVDLINRFCEGWIRGDVVNQLVQIKDNWLGGTGHRTFSSALGSAKAIGFRHNASATVPGEKQVPPSNTIAIDTCEDDDGLGREPFVHHLVDVLRYVECKTGAVVGLEGEWGSGKTWVLNRIEKVVSELSVEPRPIILRFNPWLVSGTGEIVEAFLSQLAAQLAEENQRSAFAAGAELADRLIEYAQIFSTVKHLAPIANLLAPGGGALLETIGNVAESGKSATETVSKRWKASPEKLSIVDARKRIISILERQQQRIIVIADDLDRLTPLELVTMAQAVKAVADFPNVIHLLAYDPSTASAAAKQVLRVRLDDGRRYWEKIIQIPIAIPEASPAQIQRFAQRRINRCVVDYFPDGEEYVSLQQVLPLTASLLDTPRDVSRLLPILQITLPKMKGNVNLADIVLAEAMRLKAPELVDYINRNRSTFLTAKGERHDNSAAERGDLKSGWREFDTKEQKVRDQQTLDGWKEKIPSRSRRRPFANAMAYLFEAINTWADRDRSQKLRLDRHRHWITWRSVVRNGEELDIRFLFEILSAPGPHGIDTILSDIDRFAEFCLLVADHAHEAAAVDVTAVVDLMIRAAEQFGGDQIWFDKGLFSPQAALIAVLRYGNQKVRLDALSKWVHASSHWITFYALATAKEELIGIAERPASNPNNALIDNPSELERLFSSWQEKAWAEFETITKAIANRSAIGLAWRIHHLGGSDSKIKQTLTKQLINADGIYVVFGTEEFSDFRIDSTGYPAAPFLPEIADCLRALEKQPDFEDSHNSLVRYWRNQHNNFGADPTAPDSPTSSATA